MSALVKFGFNIRTRAGMPVDNLVIQARDRTEAEAKLRQMYHHCEIVDSRVIEQAAGEGADYEAVVSLIAKQGK